MTPELAKFGDNPKLHQTEKSDDVPQTISAAVTKVTPIAGGMFVVALDNGQVWQTTQADWAVEFNPDDTVVIKRLPLGGYMITVNGDSRPVSTKRIQ
jgi:hypothetical protein